jgi:Bacterial Ig-like domain/Fibronectin type III domain
MNAIDFFKPRALQRLLAMIGLLLPLSACPQSPPPDTTPPTMLSSQPTSGSSNVSKQAALVIKFSEAMQQNSLQASSSLPIVLGTGVWNDASTVVFDPPGDWQLGSSYTLTIEGKDLAGNALTGTNTISFQTVAAPDTTPPAVPSNLKATAGENQFLLEWDANTETDLAGYNVFLGESADNVVSSVFVAKPGTSTTVTGLTNGKTYFFALDAQDTSGNHSPRSSVASVTPKDVTPPTLVSSEPANLASNLTLVPTVRFSFSEPIDANLFTIEGCTKTASTCPAGSLNVSKLGAPVFSAGSTVATFTPSADLFAGGGTFVLTLNAKDQGGNALSGRNTLEFSVKIPPDTTAPTVQGVLENLDVDNRATIRFDFSEAVDQASAEAAFLSSPAINCTWTWTQNSAKCVSKTFLEQLKTYTITMGTGVVDTAGNHMIGANQFNFTTVDAPPRVIKFSPVTDFFCNAGISAPIVITFSEPMSNGTGGAFSLTVNSQPFGGGGITWSPDATVMTFTPSSPYGYSKTVTWKLTTGANDLGGKTMTTERTASFCTELQIVIGR